MVNLNESQNDFYYVEFHYKENNKDEVHSEDIWTTDNTPENAYLSALRILEVLKEYCDDKKGEMRVYKNEKSYHAGDKPLIKRTLKYKDGEFKIV